MSLFASSIDKLNLDITSLEGSIWQGNANSNKLGIIHWDFSPISLLQAQLAYLITIEKKPHHLTLDLSVNIFQHLKLNNITGVVSSKILKEAKILPHNIANTASFEMQIKKLDIDWGTEQNHVQPDALKGIVFVKELNILGEQLGGYQLLISGKNKYINVTIQNQENAQVETELNVSLNPSNLLKVQGSLKTDNKNIQLLLNQANIKNDILFDYQVI